MDSCYIVKIDHRKDYGEDSSIEGVYRSREGAIKGARQWVEKHYPENAVSACLKNFGGDLNKGEFYSEEDAVYISEYTLGN